MGRIADSTIKGFMYQFNLSLNEILKSTNEIVKIEGIIEDIDRINEENITAIQCKYHEEVEKFQWSKVSKPILQMLKTYTNSDGNNISFVLYAFFPSEQLGEKAVSKNELNEMLNTKNIEYICDYIAHIKKIENPEIKNLVRKEKRKKKKLGSISLSMSWKFCVILMISLIIDFVLLWGENIMNWKKKIKCCYARVVFLKMM